MSPEISAPNALPTRLSLLGTLGVLHAEPLHYDLACLRSLVERLEPDLLGIEVDLETWERGDLSGAALEVLKSLIPAARRTDTVVVPLGGPSARELAPPAAGDLVRVRTAVLRGTDRLLAGLQRGLDGPAGVNGAVFGHLCGFLCRVEAAAAGEEGRRAWEATNERILDRILWAVGRDPGRRVLVAVTCRRVHWLAARLRAVGAEIELVEYHRL